jgi:hypothetical protein
VLLCHAPPRAVRTPRSFSASAMFLRPLTPAALDLPHDRQHVRREGSGGRAVDLVRLGLRLGQVGAIAEPPSPSSSGSPPAHSDYNASRGPDATCIISCQGDREAWPVAFA